MEQWQEVYITQNLPELLKIIVCDAYFISYLNKFGILDKPDVDKMKAVEKSDGKGEMNNTLLEILTKRENGYEYLTNALFQCKQTGALLIMLKGFQLNIPDKSPFELCKIDLNVDEILGKDVCFLGKVLPMTEACKDIKTDALKKLITTSLDASTYEDILCDKPLTVAVDTIPNPLPYYIPRTLTINTQLDPELFEKFENDIFCIEGIELHQLSALPKPKLGNNIPQKSTKQIHRVTARFILLEDHRHFQEIAKRTTKTVHWIKHSNNNFLYIKCSIGGGIKSIQKFLVSKNPQKFSEDKFLQKCLTAKGNAPVLLYDSPGMGKSVLLEELARRAKETQPNRSVIFLQISDFISRVRQVQQEPTSLAIKQVLVESITNTSFGKNIMNILLYSEGHRIELFLDAFDELPETDRTYAHSILDCISNDCPNIRMFITTRRHRGDELEEKFGILGHNILPFDNDNKISFFLSFWETDNEYGFANNDETKKFAQECLNTVSFKISSGEGDIAGIPLQCRMLAEIFAEKAKRVGFILDSHFQLNSIFELYRHYIDIKMPTFSENADEQIYHTFHLRESLSLLFPSKYTKFLDELPVPELECIYRIGLLEPSKSDPNKLMFLHRTLAEHFAAEFLVTFETSEFRTKLKESEFIDLFFQQALMSSIGGWGKSFQNPVICRFIDFFLSSMNLSEQYFVHLKYALREAEYYNSIRLVNLLECSLKIDAEYLFLYILDLFLDLVESGDELTGLLSLKQSSQDDGNMGVQDIKKLKLVHDLKKEECLHKLVTPAAKFSSEKLVRLSCDLLEHVTDKKFHEFQYYQYDSPIKAALQRGHYQIFEYLISFDRQKFYKLPLLHWCLEDSAYSNNNGDKEQILKRILQVRPDLLNKSSYDHPFNRAPLLAKKAHLSLIKCLIEKHADLNQTTRRNKQNVAHLVSHFSAEEYHQFVQFIVSHKAHGLFSQQAQCNRKGVTPVHRALMLIDLKTETLELLTNSCNVCFNENHLAIAINYGRSKRVIKDIKRLDGDKKKLDEETKRKLAKQ